VMFTVYMGPTFSCPSQRLNFWAHNVSWGHTSKGPEHVKWNIFPSILYSRVPLIREIVLTTLFIYQSGKLSFFLQNICKPSSLQQLKELIPPCRQSGVCTDGEAAGPALDEDLELGCLCKWSRQKDSEHVSKRISLASLARRDWVEWEAVGLTQLWLQCFRIDQVVLIRDGCKQGNQASPFWNFSLWLGCYLSLGLYLVSSRGFNWIHSPFWELLKNCLFHIFLLLSNIEWGWEEMDAWWCAHTPGLQEAIYMAKSSVKATWSQEVFF
jgi:hypothetical protein